MSKVICIRGTNGSGKSWVARKIMETADADFVKKATLSNGVLVNVYKTFVVLGSYDRQCGGCDTVKKPQFVWDAVVECAAYTNVVYEGVIVSNVFEPTMILVERLKALQAEYIPICLSTSFEQALININHRREATGKGELEKTVNVMTNHKKHISSAKKLHMVGLSPQWVSSDIGATIALKELGYEA